MAGSAGCWTGARLWTVDAKALCRELAYFSLKLDYWVLKMKGNVLDMTGQQKGSQSLLLTSIPYPNPWSSISYSQSKVLHVLMNRERNHNNCKLLSHRNNVEVIFCFSLTVSNFLATKP